MRPLELKGFLPLPPYAAEISWEPYSGSLSPGLSCPNWTSDAVGPRKGWGCVTVSLTFSSLTNNGGAESQLTVEWSFWFCGSRGGVWENPSTRPHPESVDKLRKVCYWGVQLCYSCLLGREFYSGRLLTAAESPLSAAASSSFSGQSLFQIIVSFQ